MNRILKLSVFFFILVLTGCSVMKKEKASDTVVLPLGGEVKITEGSIVYALPQTVFEFDITVLKTTEIPGPYAKFAGDMLGLENVITAENETWRLGTVTFRTVEELDPAQFYVIQGTSLMQTNLLALKESGLVLDINPAVYSERIYSRDLSGKERDEMLFPDRGASEYVSSKTDTAYRVIKADTAFIRVPYLVEMKKGMTLEEEAREAADRVLELREGKHMILTGETNVFPQNGAAIDEINRLDREYTALFAGKSLTEKKHFRIWYIPDRSEAGTGHTICNFSGTEGVLPAGSSEGEPVKVELVPSGKTGELNLEVRPVTSEKELAVRDRLYYRVPDVADVRIVSGSETLCTARRLVYQFGTVVTLPSNFIIGK
jgi:hypothetical protein